MLTTEVMATVNDLEKKAKEITTKVKPTGLVELATEYEWLYYDDDFEEAPDEYICGVLTEYFDKWSKLARKHRPMREMVRLFDEYIYQAEELYDRSLKRYN